MEQMTKPKYQMLSIIKRLILDDSDTSDEGQYAENFVLWSEAVHYER
jgi:hypothetical protein